MDKRHSVRVDTKGVHPVMTMAGIMPGGSGMHHWNVPFPDPDAMARSLAAGEATTRTELLKQAKVTADSRRQMELGTCFRPSGACMYELACSRCPYLQVGAESLPRLLEMEAETKALLTAAKKSGREGDIAAQTDNLRNVVEKRVQAEADAAR